MNPFDILGSLVQGGMRPSADRLDQALGRRGYGGPGGPPPAAMPTGGAPSGMGGSLFDLLGKMAGGLSGGGGAPSGRGPGSSPLEELTRLGSAIFGSGSGPVTPGAGPGAAGAGAMSVLGGLAALALDYAKNKMSSTSSPYPGVKSSVDLDDGTAVVAGLRRPTDAREEQQVLDVATLTVRAMLNAAKADGRIDEQESQRLLGKMQEDGVTEAERSFVIQEISKPMETEAIVRAVPNAQVAAQIYAASLMAIQVDTDAERRYMQELASRLGLNQQVVSFLHQAVGLA